MVRALDEFDDSGDDDSFDDGGSDLGGYSGASFNDYNPTSSLSSPTYAYSNYVNPSYGYTGYTAPTYAYNEYGNYANNAGVYASNTSYSAVSGYGSYGTNYFTNIYNSLANNLGRAAGYAGFGFAGGAAATAGLGYFATSAGLIAGGTALLPVVVTGGVAGAVYGFGYGMNWW